MNMASSLFGIPRSTQDVEGVIKIQKLNLDMEYLMTYASKRNVSDLLNQLLANKK